MNSADIQRRLDKLQRRIFEIQERLAGEGCTEAVFVIGAPMSGASGLSWALAEHPALWTSAEAHFFYNFVGPSELATSRLKEIYDTASAIEMGWLWTHEVTYEEFAASIGHGFDRLFLSRSSGKRWIGSAAENLLIAETLALMFPRAKFLHLIRDGRDVVCSMMSSGQAEDWAKDLRRASETWVHYVRRGLQFQKAHRDRVLDVRLERLEAQVAEQCAQILGFLDLEPDAGPARFLRSHRENPSDDPRHSHETESSGRQVVQGKKPWESWPHERTVEFDSIAGETLRLLGYVDSRSRAGEDEAVPQRAPPSSGSKKPRLSALWSALSS